MKIFINHTPHDVAEGSTLADVLAEQGLDRQGIAVAIDRKVIRKDDRKATILSEGTEITVIKAVCGG